MKGHKNKRLTQIGFTWGNPAVDEKPSSQQTPRTVIQPKKKRAFAESAAQNAFVDVKDASPWDVFSATLRVKLDVWLSKATRKDNPEGVFAVRTYSKDQADRVMQRYKTLHHENLVTAAEIYRTDDSDKHLFVVSEYIPFTLNHVEACVRHPSDAHLASIVGQILHGVAYLHSAGLRHGALKCSNVLVTFDGVIKIADLGTSHIHRGNGVHYEDEKAVGLIMMQLIHKEEPTDGKIGIFSDNDRGESLIDFLAKTELGSPADDLVKHSFLADVNGLPTWRASHLKDLLIEVAYSSQVNYIRD